MFLSCIQLILTILTLFKCFLIRSLLSVDLFIEEVRNQCRQSFTRENLAKGVTGTLIEIYLKEARGSKGEMVLAPVARISVVG